ncbi:hypothetical protein BJF79_03410 [Actinomadura sp. CNU-125]|uniref:hypothetical protein n=1 Tax=Actinomadura sp. CNU-125 TaxID=1904961 RepID=UPI00095B24C3|nr:hypothetical protein [Actinomadura sp. CNU-125]OLT12961.1 hypothetical protein BJF79_03410 [Actinomadura sp. CNU-125]
MKIYWKREDASVVSSVEEQTEQAAALARIGGQELLIDPRTNPAVRSFATELRDSRHRKILKADDRRDLRKIRVEENRAEHAEKALESLQQAREASSPAKSVRALYASRTRYMHVSLATSIVLAFGSARGLEHLTTKYESIPAGSGYIAEVGLTGLATIVILAKSELSQHGGKIKRWQDVALWSLMVAPLVASMVANVHGGNIIGATCAAGAAAFAFFSYIVADTFARPRGSRPAWSPATTRATSERSRAARTCSQPRPPRCPPRASRLGQLVSRRQCPAPVATRWTPQ